MQFRSAQEWRICFDTMQHPPAPLTYHAFGIIRSLNLCDSLCVTSHDSRISSVSSFGPHYQIVGCRMLNSTLKQDPTTSPRVLNHDPVVANSLAGIMDVQQTLVNAGQNQIEGRLQRRLHSPRSSIGKSTKSCINIKSIVIFPPYPRILFQNSTTLNPHLCIHSHFVFFHQTLFTPLRST